LTDSKKFIQVKIKKWMWFETPRVGSGIMRWRFLYLVGNRVGVDESKDVARPLEIAVDRVNTNVRLYGELRCNDIRYDISVWVSLHIDSGLGTRIALLVCGFTRNRNFDYAVSRGRQRASREWRRKMIGLIDILLFFKIIENYFGICLNGRIDESSIDLKVGLDIFRFIL
jgi:hypothetical protein